MFGLVAFAIFVLIALAGYALAAWVRTQEEAGRVLDQRLNIIGDDRTDRGPSTLLKDQRLSSIGLFNALLVRLPLVPSLTRTIRQAGLRKRTGEVLLYIPLLACIGILFTLLLHGGVALALVIGALAGSLPLMIVHRMKRTRAYQFAEQLPDALDLIRAALQAGHGFAAALTVVASEFPDPIAQEFLEVSEETRLGLPMRDALYGMNERIDDPDLPMLVIGVLIADESGGNLAEVLDNISHTVRERFKMSRDIRVLTAQGRFSGLVLTALPFIVGLVTYFLNPTYFRPMLTNPLGHYMLAYALVSIVLGHFVVRHLAKLNV
jgi:tight adherence protein B